MRKGDELIKSLSSGRNANSGRVANDLLSEFHRGYPIAELRPLLQSEDATIAEFAVWIASELASRGRELLPEVIVLLTHDVTAVRFFALDCVLSMAKQHDGGAIAQALTLLGDAERAVALKAQDFVARVPETQFDAAVAYLRGLKRTDAQHDLLRALEDFKENASGVASAVASGIANAAEALLSDSTIRRRVACALVLRAVPGDRALMESMLLSSDSVIAEAARRAMASRGISG